MREKSPLAENVKKKIPVLILLLNEPVVCDFVYTAVGDSFT